MIEDPSKWVETAEGWNTDSHYEQRKTNGFSYADWINFSNYIAWVNINALEKFKTGAGYPADLGGMDEWIAELDIMIDGFKVQFELDEVAWEDKEEMDRMLAVKDKGLALYAKRFSSLWD